MQAPVHEPHSPWLRFMRHRKSLRTLSLWAALCGLGTTLGCGAGAPVTPLDNANSVQEGLSPMCVTETQGGTTSCKDEKTWSAYAAMDCASKGLMMSKISYATSCGMGLWSQTTYDCCGSAPTPPTPMCMWVPATGTGMCRLADDWKKEGTTFCAASGLQLGDIKLSNPCTTATGYGAAEYECCTPTTTPPPTTMCTAETLAATTCVDDATWKTKAAAVCAAKMQTLGTLATGTACMGGHLDIKFTCCGGGGTPPMPPICTADSLASMTCVDDATWKAKATAACAAKKMTLDSVSPGTACMGGHLDIKYTCCNTTTPPPPPPPPPMCVTLAEASMTCVDDATWKTRADADCKAKMLTLGTLAFGTACMGGHQDIKFECCGTTTPPPPPPPMCTDEAMASMTCVDDATWKTRADAACTAKKLTLTSLGFGTACMGGHQDIKFECCGTTTPPPPPPMCSTEKAPSTAMCQTPDQWKVQGDAFCSAKHEGLSGLTLNGPCTGGFSDAQYTCCPATTTPPPVCTAGIVGDGKTCATEATLKAQADAMCKMAGATLSGFAAYDNCGPMTGSFLHAKYQCCK